MPWQSRPRFPHDFDESPEWQWPADLVGHWDEDIYGDLHERFNTTSLFIQDPKSFHRDVFELSLQAHDQQHFYRLLEERKEKRLNELIDAHRKINLELLYRHVDCSKEQRERFMDLAIQGSYDCLVAAVASILSPDAWSEGRVPLSASAASGARRALKSERDFQPQQQTHPPLSPESAHTPTSSLSSDVTAPAREMLSPESITQGSTSSKRKSSALDANEEDCTRSKRRKASPKYPAGTNRSSRSRQQGPSAENDRRSSVKKAMPKASAMSNMTKLENEDHAASCRSGRMNRTTVQKDSDMRQHEATVTQTGNAKQSRRKPPEDGHGKAKQAPARRSARRSARLRAAEDL